MTQRERWVLVGITGMMLALAAAMFQYHIAAFGIFLVTMIAAAAVAHREGAISRDSRGEGQ